MIVKGNFFVTRDQAKAYVQFVDYGSTSWVDVTKLRRGPCMDELPIQVFVLWGVYLGWGYL